MTIQERWIDAWSKLADVEDDAPPSPPPYPTMQQWTIMFLITLVYWILYTQYGPDACGEPNDEPRWTWDHGGSFWDGFHAMWNI